MPSQPVRVVVRLPFNRPDQPISDPPKVEWNAEKAEILWKVIARSRASDSAGTDWKGLAEHLQVPLPYLLYRAQTRYEEDLRGLQEIREALSPTTAQSAKPFEEFPTMEKRVSSVKTTTRATGGNSRLSSSIRLNTPLTVRARLSSLGNNSPRPKKASSSSTLTLQGGTKPYTPVMQPVSAPSDEDTDSEDETDAKEEEADRQLEEQEALDRKLKHLQKVMTNETLGLVSSNHAKEKAKMVDRGRIGGPTTKSTPVRVEPPSSRSTSQSVSSASSPQNSIPSIPSPPPGSQPHSPISRHLSPSKSSSPPAVSPRSAHGQSHMRYRPLVDRSASEQESNQGSEASSFSDLSDASLSASALESALQSNVRGAGSRFSFARSRLAGRGGGVNP